MKRYVYLYRYGLPTIYIRPTALMDLWNNPFACTRVEKKNTSKMGEKKVVGPSMKKKEEIRRQKERYGDNVNFRHWK